MSAYSISLFLHITGALGLFAGIGLEQAGLANLRRATGTAQAREWLRLLGRLAVIHAPSGITILLTGFYLAAAHWGYRAWIALSLLAIVVLTVLGARLLARQVRAIAKAMPAGDGPIPAALRQRIHDPMLRLVASLRLTLAVGIVFLMAMKPGAAGATIALVAALAIGAAAALPARRRVAAAEA